MTSVISIKKKDIQTKYGKYGILIRMICKTIKTPDINAKFSTSWQKRGDEECLCGVRIEVGRQKEIIYRPVLA